MPPVGGDGSAAAIRPDGLSARIRKVLPADGWSRASGVPPGGLRKPLPPYAEWKDRVGLRWESVQVDDAGVWGFDGRTFELLSGGRRGAPRERSGPPRPFEELCKSVAKLPGVDAVQAIAFPVVKAR